MFGVSPDYHMPLWRPPSEARSLIIQATLGCSHNRCTFCEMYKMKRFFVRSLEDVIQELKEVARGRGGRVKRLFFADGDALVLPTPHLLKLLETAGGCFPELERVALYATPQNLQRKSVEELEALRSAGLELLYYGVESGDDEVLEAVCKGADAETIVDSAAKAHAAGLRLSATVLLGIGGRKKSLDHARHTAEVLSRMDPAYASALTVMDPPRRGAPEGAGDSKDRPWMEMGVWEIVEELGELVAGMEVTSCVFRSNHASNYLPLKGTLPRDKEALLRQVKEVLASHEREDLRPEWMRGL